MIDSVDKNIKDMNMSLLQTLANSRELAKQKMQSDFDKSNKELEKSLFNGSSMQEAEIQLEKDSENLNKFVSGLEKQYALDLLIRDLRKEGINDFDKEIISMTQANELRRSELDLLQKKVNIKKMENNLDKLKNNKTVQTLVKKADLSWDFEYSADEEAIKSLEDSLIQARIDLLNYEKSLALDSRKEEIKDKSKFLDDVKALQARALADEYNNSRMFLNDLKNLDYILTDTMTKEVLKMGEGFKKYEETTKSLTERLDELTKIMIDSKEMFYGHRPAPVIEGTLLNPDKLGIKSFDTGGYTGEFNGGKLAMLHQKELVLNQDDTKNLLNSISTLKDMDLFSPLRKIKAGVENTISNVVQEFNVNANFPNAINTKEIQDAILGLPNMSRMRVKSV